MAPTPKPPPAPPSSVKGVGGFLTAKKGPLPVWAWILLGTAALYFGYRWYENRSASSTTSPADTATDATEPTDTGDEGLGSASGDGSGSSDGSSQPSQLAGDGLGGTGVLDQLNADTEAVNKINGSLSSSGSTTLASKFGLPTGVTNVHQLASGAIIYVGPGGQSILEKATPPASAYRVGPNSVTALNDIEHTSGGATDVPAPAKAATVKAKASTSKKASTVSKQALK